MDWFNVAIYVGWFAAIWATVSSLRRPGWAYADIGRSKWRWVVANGLALVIPYLGLLTATSYGFFVFPKLRMRKPRIVRIDEPPPTSMRTRRQRSGGYYGPSGGSTSSFPSYDAPRPQEVNKITCGNCGGRRWVGEKYDQVCYSCSGTGYV
jgi:hypothetical protein